MSMSGVTSRSLVILPPGSRFDAALFCPDIRGFNMTVWERERERVCVSESLSLSLLTGLDESGQIYSSS